SDLVSIGTNHVAVKGLENGTTYQVAVVSINADGTPSAVSDVVNVTPMPTLGFDDLYQKDGGTGLVACAVGGASSSGGGLATAALGALGLVVAARRRRRRRRRQVRSARRARWIGAARRSALGLVLVAATAQSARAGEDEDPDRISHGYRFGEEPEK